MTKKKIVTHSGPFHADDVFGVAVLQLHLGKENVEVVRSREKEDIDSGDYVLDVGFVYDADKNRFDHHQIEGAGERENGIPYASFGLIWKEFGEQVCGSKDVADQIDRVLIQPIDATDVGFDLASPNVEGVHMYSVAHLMEQFMPTWKETADDIDERFAKAVEWATQVLLREIELANAAIEAIEDVKKTYEAAPNKELIVFDESQPYGRSLIMSTLMKYEDSLYGVFYSSRVKKWSVVATRKQHGTFETRKPFPEAWRGKDGQELADVTGVASAKFCHRTGFMCGTDTKEDAIKLAQLSLEA